MALTQDMLDKRVIEVNSVTGETNTEYANVRNTAYVDIFMYVQDKDIKVDNITANDVSPYYDISALKDLARYNIKTMATLEPNLWLLNGQFFTPVANNKYDGYMSNNMSDENGEFSTNPKITITVSQSNKNKTQVDTEHLTLVFNRNVPSAYPKQIKITCKDPSSNILGEEIYDTADLIMPNPIFEIPYENVKSVIVELIGTVVPYRRMRLVNFMFGKTELFTQDELVNCKITDKASYVPDTIPSKIFSWTMMNYDKKYNIDNPNNSIPVLDRSTEVMMRWGYKLDDDSIEYDNWQKYYLLDVSTSSDETVTFEAGSLLDVLTDIYNIDVYQYDAKTGTYERTVRDIIDALLAFCNLDSANYIIYGNNKFTSTIVDRLLPQQEVRQLIQLCAYACGATIIIEDDGRINFADIDIINLTDDKFPTKFGFKSFTDIPEAEQLEYTNDVGIVTTFDVVDTSKTENLGTATLQYQRYDQTMNFSAGVNPYFSKNRDKVSDYTFYSDHVVIHQLNSLEPVELEVSGYKSETKSYVQSTNSADALLIDSTLNKYVDDTVLQKYKQWYSRRFKYKVNTRGEPLLRAGQLIKIETQFTGSDSMTLPTYVLETEINYDGGWSGSMEVIAL